MSRSYNKEEGYPKGYLKKLYSIRNSLVEIGLGITEAGYEIKFPNKSVSRREHVGHVKRRKLPTPGSLERYKEL